MPFPLKRNKLQVNSPKHRSGRGGMRNGSSFSRKNASRHPLLHAPSSDTDSLVYERSDYYIPSVDIVDEDRDSVGSASTLTANSSSSYHPHPGFHIHQSNSANSTNGLTNQTGSRKRTHSEKRQDMTIDPTRYQSHVTPLTPTNNVSSVQQALYMPSQTLQLNHSSLSETSSGPPRMVSSSTPKSKRSGRPPLASSTTNNTQPSETASSTLSSDHLPRPSEALFIQCLVDHCKRIAPLWFSGVSQLREKNREENRRVNIGSCLSSSDQWDAIADQIHNMDATSETESVVNLLKKLYKEVHTDSVLWFIKCWLQMPETRVDNRCAFSRGDAKSRMRRIDGGRGSDKVWRLDTLVAMLYHGLPLSSTDTHLLQHTCGQELCVRPQHLRFRANAVALVIVLKALQQAGYRVLPPSKNEEKGTSNGVIKKELDQFNGVVAKRKRSEHSLDDEGDELQHLEACQDLLAQREDDCVDISGPFTIQEIQQFRKEELHSCSVYLQKYTLSPVDEDIIQRCPLLRAHLENNKRTLICGDVKPSVDCKRVSQPMPKQTQAARPPVRNSTSHVLHQETSVNAMVPAVSSNKERTASSCSNTAAADAVAISALMSLSSSTTTPAGADLHESDHHVTCSSTANSHFSLSTTLLPATSSCNYNTNHPSAFTPIAFQQSPLASTGQIHPISLGSHSTQPGRITPRQPAKKRLEARTPPFDLEELESPIIRTPSTAAPLNSSSFSTITSNGDLKSIPYIKCDVDGPTGVAEEDQELAEIMSADERISDVGVSTGTSPMDTQNISEGFHRRLPNMTQNSMTTYPRSLANSLHHLEGTPWNGTKNHQMESSTDAVLPASALMNRGIMTPDVVNILSSLRNPLDPNHSVNNDFYSILSSLSRVTPSPQLHYISLASNSVDTVSGFPQASTSSITTTTIHTNQSSTVVPATSAASAASDKINGCTILKNEY